MATPAVPSVSLASVLDTKQDGLCPSVCLHMSETVRSAKVREESQKLQQSFGVLSWPAPECVPVSRVGSGVSLLSSVSACVRRMEDQSVLYLLSVNEAREFDRVSNEEHGRVVEAVSELAIPYINSMIPDSHPVENTLLCPHLDRKPTEKQKSASFSRPGGWLHIMLIPSWVPSFVATPSRASNSRKSHGNRSSSSLLEDIGGGQLFGEVGGDL